MSDRRHSPLTTSLKPLAPGLLFQSFNSLSIPVERGIDLSESSLARQLFLPQSLLIERNKALDLVQHPGKGDVRHLFHVSLVLQGQGGATADVDVHAWEPDLE